MFRNIFLQPCCFFLAIYKTRNTGTGNGIQGMRGTWGMFTRIAGNIVILLFQGMLKKIPGNVQEDSGERSTRFRGMFEKIPGDLNLDLFCEVLLIFDRILQLNCEKQRNIFCATNYYI